MDPNYVIDYLGGTKQVARLFEITPASVSEWRREGIPKARLQTLKLMHPELFADPVAASPSATTAGASAP